MTSTHVLQRRKQTPNLIKDHNCKKIVLPQISLCIRELEKYCPRFTRSRLLQEICLIHLSGIRRPVSYAERLKGEGLEGNYPPRYQVYPQLVLL